MCATVYCATAKEGGKQHAWGPLTWKANMKNAKPELAMHSRRPLALGTRICRDVGM